MKTDTRYSHINVCPKTQSKMSDSDINKSGGVCPHCGHINDYSFTHSEKVAGRYNRPTLYERLFQGEKLELLRRDEEDKIMASLTQ